MANESWSKMIVKGWIFCMVKSITNVFSNGSTDQSFNGSIDRDLVKYVVILRKLLNRAEQMCWPIDQSKVDKH